MRRRERRPASGVRIPPSERRAHLLGSVHDLEEALLSILELLVQNGNHFPHHLHYHVIVEEAVKQRQTLLLRC